MPELFGNRQGSNSGWGGTSYGRQRGRGGGSFAPSRMPLWGDSKAAAKESSWDQILYSTPSQDTANAQQGGSMPAGEWSGGRGLEGVSQWSNYIGEASNEHGVPWQVIASVMGIESGGTNGGVSPAGAVGLMQVMPEYWQDTANKYGGDLNDPRTNIMTGAAVLKYYYDTYGSWENAAKAYLAGSPTSTATDAYGTGVDVYGELFNTNMSILGGQNLPHGDIGFTEGNVTTPNPNEWQNRNAAASLTGIGGGLGQQNATSWDNRNPAQGVFSKSQLEQATAWENRQKGAQQQPAPKQEIWAGNAVSPEAGNALDIAMTFIGMPYEWGGADPSTSFDCSGLTQYAFGQAGKNIPRTAQQQYGAAAKISSQDAQAGDLIFFQNTAPGDPISHVGIYLGDGKMLHAGSGGIVVADITSDYWQQHFAGFGRV